MLCCRDGGKGENTEVHLCHEEIFVGILGYPVSCIYLWTRKSLRLCAHLVIENATVLWQLGYCVADSRGLGFFFYAQSFPSPALFSSVFCHRSLPIQ